MTGNASTEGSIGTFSLPEIIPDWKRPENSPDFIISSVDLCSLVFALGRVTSFSTFASDIIDRSSSWALDSGSRAPSCA